MSPADLVLMLLVLALLGSGVRLAWRMRRGELATGRMTLRFLGQAAVAGLLWFALFPPPVEAPAGALVVVTPGTGELPARDPADAWVALPGADAGPDIERVPDLATALRRHPGRAPVRVLGHGLPARDHDAAAGWPLVFQGAPLPDGLLAIDAPGVTVQGRVFAVRGRLQGFTDGVIELLDPAGAVLASAVPDDAGSFELAGLARIAGPSRFRLHWRNGDDTVTGGYDLQVDVVAPARPRLLVLAGGPSPELKYLRRWAVDAGLPLHTVIEVGGGVQLGDAPLPVNAATLAGFDLAVVDERAWRQLGSHGRGQLREAVRAGLGLLVRITGQVDRSDLASLRDWGLLLEDFDGARSLPWPDGPGAETASLVLSRRPLRLAAREGRPLLSAPDGDTLVAWRNEGRGRIGATVLSDSYRLWLSGRQAAHGQLWADTVQTLARARGDEPLAAPRPAWLGERTLLCGVTAGDTVTAPDGDVVALAVDPATGAASCAGYWPSQAGTHRWQRGDASVPLAVRDPADHPAMLAAERQAATAELAARAPAAESLPLERAGPRWPWWLAWLFASAATWWFERRAAAAKPGA